MTTKTNLSRRTFLSASGAALSAGAVSFPNLSIAQAVTPAATTPLYGPPPGVAKLNANENPYGPSPKAIAAMTEAISQGAYYVNATAETLKALIAERHGLTKEHIILSSGSSGVLTSLAMMAAQKGSILGSDLFWDTTSRMGTRNSQHGITRTAKTEDLSVDLDAMHVAVDGSIAMVQICNPNNPTGSIVDPKELRAFCKKVSQSTMVLVDEAYNEVTDEPETNSMVPLIKAGYNVVVARTFSKIYGLAGMRVGYLIAAPDTVERISAYGTGSYGLNQAGIAAAIASYNDTSFIAYSKSKIMEAREMIAEAVAVNGLSALPSQTSFMFVNLGDISAEDFRLGMAKQNVLIRGIYQDYTHWSRVSMGKIPDVEKYIAAMPKVLDSLT
ncbi:MAG: aminotransferase class I/II-fold pyridoxal phosphate-dependent enzyme [Gammaproteobacteria bacterium TMED92]|nr:MAG: aminotransferase class I/II-fold pyridoxal phosphate-dependent enzyme [Gammaproteobacteria bacterium TMED92]